MILSFRNLEGFWRARIARTVTAFIATNSIADFSAKALKSLAISETKLLPELPAGTLKLFFLQ